jgi:hypothetical protein
VTFPIPYSEATAQPLGCDSSAHASCDVTFISDGYPQEGAGRRLSWFCTFDHCSQRAHLLEPDTLVGEKLYHLYLLRYKIVDDLIGFKINLLNLGPLSLRKAALMRYRYVAEILVAGQYNN